MTDKDIDNLIDNVNINENEEIDTGNITYYISINIYFRSIKQRNNKLFFLCFRNPLCNRIYLNIFFSLPIFCCHQVLWRYGLSCSTNLYFQNISFL